MIKVHRSSSTSFVFHCPGCGENHKVNNSQWKFNNDLDKPTFEPSILYEYKETLCHSYVREGKIIFLNDSSHELRGKEVELPNWYEGGYHSPKTS